MINDLCKLAHDAAVSKGFYERQRNLPELLMLVVSELAEAMEADRHDKWARDSGIGWFAKNFTMDGIDFAPAFEKTVKDSVEDEIADAFIRLFDLCGFYGIDIEAHIKAKMAYNATRPAKHGKKY